MILKDLVDVFFLRFKGLDKTNKDHRNQVKSYLNLFLPVVYRSSNWEFRKRTGQLILIPNYTTGNCSIVQYDGTNDLASRTVTFAGSTLTQSMRGRFFKPAGSDTWYRIIYISGDTAYLDTPVVDATAGGLSFTIWKRFHYLKSDVDIVTDFIGWDRNSILEYRSSTNQSDKNANLASEGSPFEFGAYGVDSFDDTTYETGTISGILNTNIITGSATAFFANVDN